MDKHDTPAGDAPALAELEGGYWRNKTAPVWYWRVADGELWFDGGSREWIPSGTGIDGLLSSEQGGYLTRMTPAEIAATWPELAPAAPTEFRGIRLVVDKSMPDGHAELRSADGQTVRLVPPDKPAAPAVAGEGRPLTPCNTYWRDGSILHRVNNEGKLEGLHLEGGTRWGGCMPEREDPAEYWRISDDHEPYSPRVGEWLDCGTHGIQQVVSMGEPQPGFEWIAQVDIDGTIYDLGHASLAAGEWHPCPPPDTAPAADVDADLKRLCEAAADDLTAAQCGGDPLAWLDAARDHIAEAYRVVCGKNQDTAPADPPIFPPLDAAGPRVVVGTDPATGTTATMLHDPAKDTFTVLGFNAPADPAKFQREINAAFEAATKFALKPRALGQSEARKLASLFAELKESTAKPKRGKWRKRAERWKKDWLNVCGELRAARADLATAQGRIAELEACPAFTRCTKADGEDCTCASMAGYERARQQADHPPAAPATDPPADSLAGITARAEDALDALHTDIAAAKAATDPAGYREGQVLKHVSGGLYRCTRSVDAVDGQVTVYSLEDGFHLSYPAVQMRPIPPHPGCVVLASIATQREYYVVNSIDADGTILCDGDFRFAPGNFTVMAPAPGWQGEEATRHDA